MNITTGSMLRSLTPALAALSLTFFLLGLGGCGGISLASFPPVPTQTPIGVLQGSDFGGHAPITGAHIFLFEATWNGNSAGIKSLLSSGSTATSGTYPVAQDTATGSVTNGLYYVTSDSNGAFNITGDYSCDAGWPVYLYAAGGTPGGSTPITITAIASSLSSGTTTYTFTAANLLYTGQTVQFSSSSLGGKWATLNGTTQTVLATPTTTSFQIATTIAPSGSTNTQGRLRHRHRRHQSSHCQPGDARQLSWRRQLHQRAPLRLSQRGCNGRDRIRHVRLRHRRSAHGRDNH